MSANTKIEWADHTFNPWEGCTAVGPGCDHCYAEARNKRFGKGVAVNWGPGAPRRRTSAWNWRLPLKWNRAAEDGKFMECPSCGWRGVDDAESSRLRICTHCGTRLNRARPRVFCASLADVFDNEVPDAWRADLYELIAGTPHLDWLLLTKRIGNAARMLPSYMGGSMVPNVWIGATVVNQTEADRDIPKLLAVPAAKRFLSIEPMLGPISLRWLPAFPENAPYIAESPTGQTGHLDGLRRLDWVICGGESGPHARPMHPDWARSLRDQCAAAGVPFLFKQWGEWSPPYGGGCLEHLSIENGPWQKTTICDGAVMTRLGKKAAGRLLDGREHNGIPGDAP